MDITNVNSDSHTIEVYNEELPSELEDYRDTIDKYMEEVYDR